MDTKSLIKKLNEVFCNNNKSDKRYTEVWLSDIDFGGIYNNGKFDLCVKATHQIDSCSDEIRDILFMLNKEAKDELEYIWAVRVYNSEDQIHCHSSNLRVYDEATAC